MSCCGISSLTLEIILAAFNFLWLFGWWSVGHYFYWAFSNCRDHCQSIEPVGMGIAFLSQVLFFLLARHVLNFVYKKELPGGEDFTKEIASLIGQAKTRPRSKK